MTMFKKGDKVIPKDTTINQQTGLPNCAILSHLISYNRFYGTKFFVVRNVIKHQQRLRKIGYNLICPISKNFIVSASREQLKHYIQK